MSADTRQSIAITMGTAFGVMFGVFVKGFFLVCGAYCAINYLG
tara:strand:- start:31 stop:159 length:129 start_codon:yes stop_codon:yes gene_type:complete